jgi:hypothetical protein
VNVAVVVPSPRAVPDAVARWERRLEPEDHGLALVLAATEREAAGRFDLHPLELDLTRSHYRRRVLQAGATAWPSPLNPCWRALSAGAWHEIVWNVRALDPDVVDLRALPQPEAFGRRLAAAIAPIRVVWEGATPERVDTSWRRYDPNALVSVVLPVYRGARYLRHALETCLTQSHDAIELIVVDDCSPDETPDIIAEYARNDRRIVGIRNARNLRLPGALNVGFARATGALLTWTSHDNYHAPDAIETLARYLSTWTDVDVAYGAYRLIDDAGRERGTRWPSPPWQIVHWNPVGPYFLYRRAVHDAVGPYRADMEFLEDYEYWVRVSKRFRLMRLPWPRYVYREHGESMTARATDMAALRARLHAEHFSR